MISARERSAVVGDAIGDGERARRARVAVELVAEGRAGDRERALDRLARRITGTLADETRR